MRSNNLKNSESKYIDIDGKEITLEAWGFLIKDEGYRIIGRNFLDDDTIICTLWNGSIKKPFETYVISTKKRLDEEIYNTKKEALEGHKKYLRKYNYL